MSTSLNYLNTFTAQNWTLQNCQLFQEVERGLRAVHGAVMRNGRKGKYAVSDADSNLAFLFLLYFFFFFFKDIEWQALKRFCLTCSHQFLSACCSHERTKSVTGAAADGYYHQPAENIPATRVNVTDLFIVRSLSVCEVWVVSSLTESYENAVGVTEIL